MAEVEFRIYCIRRVYLLFCPPLNKELNDRVQGIVN